MLLPIGLAQNADLSIDWGPVHKQFADARPQFVGLSENGHYVQTRISRHLYEIRRFDENMDLVASKRISLIPYGQKRDFVDLVMMQGRLYLFSTYQVPMQNEEILLMEKLDPISLTIVSEARMLEKIKKSRNTGFKIRVSNNEESMLIFTRTSPRGKDFESYVCRVYDEDFEEIWSEEVELPYKNRLFTIKDVRVSNQGDVFVSGRLRESAAEKRAKQKVGSEDRSHYSYKLLSYRNQGTEAREYGLDLREDFIIGFQYELGRGNDIICGGFYAERRQEIKGVFSFSIDGESGEIRDLHQTAFSGEFIRKMIGERRERNGRGLAEYELRDIVVRSDGGLSLIGERFFIREYCYSVGGVWFEHTDYHYLDIILVNVNPDGSVAWYENIPKRQVSGSQLYSSYQMAIGRDKLFFLFNDHIKNKSSGRARPRKARNFARNEKGHLGLVSVDANGNLTKASLGNLKELGVALVPSLSTQYDHDEVLVYGRRRRKYRYGSLKLY
ncbi:MAG: hypothetical protein AAF206_12150 [Bacteroidota bacterium]